MGELRKRKKKENLYYLQNFTYTCILRLEAPFVLTTCNARAKRRNCKKMNKYRTLEVDDLPFFEMFLHETFAKVKTLMAPF